MKKWRLVLLLALSAVQLAMPGWMIARQLATLRMGRVFKFRTAPVDPYDAFRGRFVALQFKAASAQTDEKFEHAQPAYVVLAEDADGFATVERVTHERLHRDNVLRAKAGYSYDKHVQLDFGFDRYYMDEKAAPQAEAAYRAASRRDHENAWVTVRVRDGYAALEELYIDGLPVRDFLRAHPEH